MILAKPRFADLRQAWQRRPAAERLRLVIGGGISLALVGYLLVQKIDLPTWREGDSAVLTNERLFDALPPVTAMDTDAWRQGALRHSVVLDDLIEQDDGWHLSGHADSLAAFEHFSTWAAQQGWWALDWSLSRDGETGFAVEARFVAQLELEPDTTFVKATP